MQKITQTEVKTVFSADNSQLTKTITETEKTIEKLGNTADKSGGVFGKFGQDVKEGIALGFGVSTVGMVTSAIGMVKDGIASMVNTGMEYEATMSKVQAITNATGSEMEQMSELAKKLGAETSKSASESAEAMTYMGMAGWSTQEILAGLPGVLNLSVASGEDFARVSDIVTDNLTAFGMEAEDAGYYADVLAYAMSNANVSVDSLGESLKYIAPVATGAGVSMEETVAMVSLLGDAGIKGSQAGTTLRSVILNLTGANEKATAKLKELGVAIHDKSGKMRSMADIIGDLSKKLVDAEGNVDTTTATLLVGKTAVSGFTSLLQTGGEKLGSFSKALEDSAGTADRMSETMRNNLAGSVEELGGAFETLGLKIYDKAQPFLKKFTDDLTNFISWTGELIGANEKAGESFTIFGQEVSESTHKALSGIEEMSNTISEQIGILDVVGGQVTPDFVNKMLTNYGGLKQGVVDNVTKMHDEQLSVMQKYGETALGYNQTQLDELHRQVDSYKAGKIQKVTELEAEAQKILSQYGEGNVTMSATHKDRLLEIQSELTRLNLETLSGEIAEKQSLMETYASESFKINKDNADMILKTALEHKNKMVETAKKKLEEELIAIQGLKQIGKISDEEHGKMVTEAQKNYDKLIEDSDESFKKVVGKVGEVLGDDAVTAAEEAGDDVKEAYLEAHSELVDDVAEEKVKVDIDKVNAIRQADGLLASLKTRFDKTYTVRVKVKKSNVFTNMMDSIFGNTFSTANGIAQQSMGRRLVPTRNMYAESGVRNTNNNTINYNGNYNFRSKQDIDYFMKQTAKLVDRKY